jgi:hypothetical protein
MLSKVLIGVVGSAGALLIGVPGTASAQPEPAPPPPPPPNVNALAPVKLSEYGVADYAWYVFTGPPGVTCVLQKNGGYGCSGPLPGAPNGANLVSGGPGPAGFANADRMVFGTTEPAKPLPAGSRISYQTVSCGNDGATTTCVDSRSQSGFVITPTATWVFGETNPLLDRPEGTNPFFN